MTNTHSTALTTSAATSLIDIGGAISDIHRMRRSYPFRSAMPVKQMNTYAAHAIDVIEKHTGLDADLADMLVALKTHAGSKMHWIRIIGRHEIFIVFRDLSMITYLPKTPNSGKADLSGLLPVALALDLISRQKHIPTILLEAHVDQAKDSGETLSLSHKVKDEEHSSLVSPVAIKDLQGQLSKAMNSAEECIEVMRQLAYSLPPTRRPHGDDLADNTAFSFEKNGIWIKGGDIFYWPPYLSRPTIPGKDLEELCNTFRSFVELALWACPELPDEFEVTLYTALTSYQTPAFSFTMPAHLPQGSKGHIATEEAMNVLEDNLDELFLTVGYDYPIGHSIEAGPITGATAYPVATVTANRPDAERVRRITEVDENETITWGFEELPGWVDPI